MIDIRMNAQGDMDTSAFDLHPITGGEQVAQRLQIKLRTLLGEVPLNTAAGVPWFEEILGSRPPALNRADAILREQILSTPEVESIEYLNIDFTASQRALAVDFKAISIYGPLSVTVQSPEVV